MTIKNSIIRHMVAIVVMVCFILASGVILNSHAESVLWLLSAWGVAAGSAAIIYIHWVEAGLFSGISTFRLVRVTAAHLLADTVVLWWLSFANDTPNGAAFITSVAYVPVLYMIIRSYRR